MSTELNHNNSNKVNEVLGSLDGIQRAKAPAFFYTRLKARLEREFDNAGPLVRLLTKPALALSFAAIILLLNTAVIMQLWQQDSTMTTTDNSTVVVADYTMGAYPVYDENLPEP